MRKITVASLAAVMLSLLVVMMFFGQASRATLNTTAPTADLYGGMSAPYLPLHTIEPIF